MRQAWFASAFSCFAASLCTTVTVNQDLCCACECLLQFLLRRMRDGMGWQHCFQVQDCA